MYQFPLVPSVLAATRLAIDDASNYDNTLQQVPLLTSSHRQWVQQLGIDPDSLALVQQVHGDQVIAVSRPGRQGVGDGMVTTKSGITLAVRTADCAGIFLVAENSKGIGLLHAGWRGTRQGIIQKAVQYIMHQWQILPHQLWVAVSPALQGCCYQVTEEFLEHFPAKYFVHRDSTWRFKFEQVLKDELLTAGIPDHQQFLSPWCTACSLHPAFHSYRRDKTPQRLLNIIRLTDNSEAK